MLMPIITNYIKKTQLTDPIPLYYYDQASFQTLIERFFGDVIGKTPTVGGGHRLHLYLAISGLVTAQASVKTQKISANCFSNWKPLFGYK